MNNDRKSMWINSKYSHDNLSTCAILNCMVEFEDYNVSKRVEKYSSVLCCPCMVLGRIHSMQARDKDFHHLKIGWGQYINLGGCIICLQTAPMCFFGWCCSPCLGLYVGVQRQTLQLQYKDSDTMIVPLRKSMFMWPSILYQNLLIVEKKERLGLLRFHDDLVTGSPPILEKRILIIGSENCGKTTLFQKLLLLLPETREMMQLYATTGVRAYDVNENKVSFLSIIDIPEVKIRYKSYLETISSQPIDYILLCFDASDPYSFDTLLDMYNMIEFMTGERIIVALKMELVPPENHIELESEGDTFNRALHFADEEHLLLFDVSSHQNIGINQLFFTLTGTVAEKLKN